MMSTCALALEGNIIDHKVYTCSARTENPLQFTAPAFCLVAEKSY